MTLLVLFNQPTGGATSYTLTANAGVYALTGGSASLKVGRKITANAGSYSLTGGSASLKVARTLSALAGSYSLSGGSANLTKSGGPASYTITANPGAYAITGASVSLKVARSLSATAGSYTLSGGSAVLTKAAAGPQSYTLTANPGSYSITGASATLSWSGEAKSASNEIELRPWYVRRGKKLHIFATAQEADGFIEAEKAAQEAVEQAQRTSRRARKRLRERVFSREALPVQTIEIDRLAEVAGRFGVKVDMPALVETQDWESVMLVQQMALAMQEEEDLELLLLSL